MVSVHSNKKMSTDEVVQPLFVGDCGLRQVCQAIEKYDTDELLEYLSHGHWSVITDKERTEIDKENTKELKLLRLRKMIGKERRVKKFCEVLRKFACCVHEEVTLALSCYADISKQPVSRSSTKPVKGRQNSSGSVLNKSLCSQELEYPAMRSLVNDHLSKLARYEVEKSVSSPRITTPPKGMMTVCCPRSNHSASGGSSTEQLNSDSDLSGSPMDCSHAMLLVRRCTI